MRLILLFSMAISALGHAASNCELEMSKRVRVATNILRRAVDLGILSPARLNTFANSAKWYDPLEHSATNDNSLAVKRGLKRQFTRMNNQEKAQMRAAAKELFKALSKESAKEEDAHKETAFLFLPKYLGQLDFENGRYAPQNHPLVLGTMKGRPVIMARLGGDGRDLALLFDPFNLEPGMQVSEIKYPGVDRIYSEREGIFELNGHTIAANFGDGLYYDVTAQKPILAETLNVPRLRTFESAVVLTENGETKLYGSIENADAQGIGRADAVYEFNLSYPENEPKKIADFALRSLRATKTSLGTIVSGNQQGKAGFIQHFLPATGTFLGATGAWTYNGTFGSTLQVYEDQGDLKTVFARGNQVQKYEVGVVDIKSTQKKYHDIKAAIQHIGVVKFADGTPHAYFNEEKDLTLLNLRTMSSRTISTHATRLGVRTQSFEWRRRPYLVWFELTSSPEFKVLDPATMQIVASIKTHRTVNDFSVFTYQDEVYIFAINYSSMPEFYQLTGREPK